MIKQLGDLSWARCDYYFAGGIVAQTSVLRALLGAITEKEDKLSVHAVVVASHGESLQQVDNAFEIVHCRFGIAVFQMDYRLGQKKERALESAAILLPLVTLPDGFGWIVRLECFNNILLVIQFAHGKTHPEEGCRQQQ